MAKDPAEPTTVGLDRDRVRDRADAVSLRVIGDARFEAHPLPRRGALVIGRGRDADVSIDDPSISREHARLHIGDGFEVEDLDSANGTSIGGRALAPGERVAIGCGEVVDLGSVMLILQRGYRPAAAAASGPDDEPDGERSTALVIEDPEMVRLYKLVDRIAASDIGVLILGETGAGKEVVAEELHRRSDRAAAPLLRLNCGGFSEALLESELFGHEKGAFTGADATKPGLLETAEGGTVFLDEIGEMAPGLQAKLLRVLEDRVVTRVGAVSGRAVDVRFVAATNRDLEAEIGRGGFRRDLYYRLSGVTLLVPPLRERPSEIALLARAFVAEAAARHQRPVPVIAPGAEAALRAHSWPGNIRELKNCVERALLLCGGPAIELEHIGPVPATGIGAATETAADPAGAPLRDQVAELERRRVVDAMEACGGNQTRAAKMLGISRNTLAARLDAFGIRRPRKKR